MVNLASVEKFDRDYNGQPIILIGAGKRTKTLLEKYDWKFIFVIDSDSDRHGKIEVDGKTLNVHGWDYFEKNITKDSIVLITPQKGYQDLYDRVRGILEEDNIWIMSYMYALQWDANRIRQSQVPFEITRGIQQKIPKTIHYFWFSGDPFPDNVKRCIDSWHKYCPDYKYKLWNLDNYKTDNVFCNEALSKKSWSIASDYSRCDVIYREGGIYLDVDVELVKSLDDLLYDEGFFSFESAFGVDPGSGMGCVAGNKVFGEIIKRYDELRYIGEDGELQYENISLQYTKVLERFGLKRNGMFQRIENISCYPPLVLNPYSYMTGIDSRYDKTYGVHHWVSSWITDEDRKEMEIRKKIISSYAENNGGIMNLI